MPTERERHLSEVADTVRRYHARTDEQALVARERQQHLAVLSGMDSASEAAATVRRRLEEIEARLGADTNELLEQWKQVLTDYSGDEYVYTVRDREFRVPLTRTTLSGSAVPRVALPRIDDDGAVVRFMRRENLPGGFPYTAGVFPFKRDAEAPARMFAGEGDPARTNRRFHLLAEGQPAVRLSTAFDSVTLYGRDPEKRPDVYGKVGTSGVSIATLDDMKVLYGGFDLCDPTTSVSMTINGPAPTILAMFFNTAIDQQVERFVDDQGREPTDEERAAIAARTVATVRGTVQADILKEDQGQNTSIFTTEISLRCKADVQEWFIDHDVRNF
jgi:methylmalonyl-CoA mutase